MADYIKSRPSDSYGQIGSTLGLSRGQVARIARRQGIKRQSGKRHAALDTALAVIEAASPRADSAPASEAATPPLEETISTAPDAPPAVWQTAAVADATDGDGV